MASQMCKNTCPFGYLHIWEGRINNRGTAFGGCRVYLPPKTLRTLSLIKKIKVIMKQRTMTSVLLLLCALCMRAATIDVKTNLWSGTQTVTDGWQGSVQVTADGLQQAVEGDVIAVTVSEISQTASYPQVSLRKTAGWAQFDPAVGVNLQKDAALPYEARMTLTADVVNEIKANGFVVTGCGFTATSIDLIQKKELEEGEKGNPVHTVWTGDKAIDWSEDVTDGWLKIDAAGFANAQTGWKLRFNYSDLAIGAQGHISTGGWTDMPDATEYVQLTASFFEFTITEAMLAELKAGGCIVTGIGFSLTSVELIDPAQVPMMSCAVDNGSIKCWEADEQPQISVTLQSLEGSDMNTNVTLKLRTDAYEDYFTKTENVTVQAGGTVTVTIPLTLEPGFYHAVVEANYGLLRDFNIGYNPTAITAAPDMQPDFNEFWAKAKEDLAAVPIDAKVTLDEEKSTGARNVYFVEMQSVDNGDGKPVTIRGYYAVPKAEGTYPVVITQNGYDSNGASQIYWPDTDSTPEWIELNISNRGQLINNRDPYKDENAFYGEDYKENEWFAYNFGDKDTYYYRGAYMDVVRSIDFVIASNELDCAKGKVQADNIFMTGGSQGGAFTIAGAALGDGRINAIAPSIQFMGDFPNYFKVGSWPASTARAMQEKLAMSDEEMYEFLSYFDTKNLATLVTCPVTTAMGLQDPVCPPRTNFAPYVNFKSEEKQYVVNPDCQHETPVDWYNSYMEFFKAHLKGNGEPEEPSEPTIVPITLWQGEQECTDDWQGYQIIDASKCQLTAAGDEIVVTISATSPTCQYPQLMLNDKGWAQLVDTEAIPLNGIDMPYEATITVTEAMAEEIKANGFIVKGAGYTFTSVVLKHKAYPSDTEKGNAATTVWEGEEAISWVEGSNNSILIDKADLPENMKEGDKVRVYITGLGVEQATGRLLANWTALDGFSNITPLKGNYYEYTLSAANVNALKESGLRVSGNRYTATRVDIIDPAKEYLIISQIDDNDIKAWEKNETPNLTMTMTNVEAEDVTVPYTITIYRDMVDEETGTHSVYRTYTTDVTLPAGGTTTETIDMTDLDEPGFYQLIASVDGNDVCSYNIGYDPTGIVSPDDSQPDFWKYWDEAKAELATVDMDITMTEQPEYSTEARKVYLVEMKSVADEAGGEPVTIKGYYAEPTAEGIYPTLIQYQGTDNGTGSVGTPMNGDDRKDWCEFILSTRGQKLCRDDKYGYDFYSYGWGDMREHYYRNAYLDCVRAVDFIKSCEKADKDAIFAAGGSQGGCFTYVAAGLTQAFRAIAPSITGHADFTDGMRIVNWPRQKFLDAQAALGYTDEERDVFNSYYDTMNFASRVNCPVITCFSLQDTTDPAHTNIAPYNLLVNVDEEDKEYIINPFLGHSTPADWTQTYMDFFEKYIGTPLPPTGIETITTDNGNGENAPMYNIAGMKVGKDYKGIVIQNGKKRVKK